MIWLALFILLVVTAALLALRLIDRHWPPTGRTVIDRLARGLVLLAAVAIAAQLHQTISVVQEVLTSGPELGEELEQAILAFAGFVDAVARVSGPLVALAAILDHLARRLPPASRPG